MGVTESHEVRARNWPNTVETPRFETSSSSERHLTAPPSALVEALRGRYVFERELGQGGMARVYLARDIRHDRPVAVKVLHPELAALIGAERFLHEIKVTANLQHPHILPLHDSGESGGLLWYVMPYVEGETLRTKLQREKQLGIEEAVTLTRGVASALDYAHRHGVIHRDVKPENVLLHDGQPLVADFGIALAVSQAGGSRLTETGLSIGTPQYMSPEQAMGDRELDARSDIYSLGVMLYEMLTGDPPYTGSTAQAIVAKVITEKPAPVTARRDTIPAQVAAAVHKAIAKLPADRFHSAAEFAHALAGREAPFVTERIAAAPRPARFAAAGQRFKRLALPLAAAMLLGALAAGSMMRRAAAGISPAVVRASVELAQGSQIAREPTIALSPDGSVLAVSALKGARPQIYIRHLDAAEFTPVAGTEGGFRPFFSPDGEWIAFTADGKLKKVPVDGGAAVTLANADWGGGSWGPDGTIVYTLSYNQGLWRVPAGGGDAVSLTKPDHAAGELAHWWPQILPDGRHVVFTNFSTPVERAKIELLDLATGKRTVLVRGGVFARYVPAGYLAFSRGEDMLAAPFDLAHLRVTGSPTPVLEGVAAVASNGVGGFAVAGNGTLAYVPASVFNAESKVVWVDRSGTQQPALPQPGRYGSPAVSPDGRRLAVTSFEPGHNSDVWVYELARGVLTRLTLNEAADFSPLWTPDGRRLIYTSERPVFDLYWRPADASVAELPLLTSESDKYPYSISPDGKVLAFGVSAPNSRELWLLPLDGSGKARPFLQNRFSLGHPAISPEGHWLAYDSDESGRREVYVQSYPDPALSRRQVSTGGGLEPRWTRGGRELVYRNGDTTLAVSAQPSSGETGIPAVLFVGPYRTPEFGERSYDVTADGRRFVMVSTPPESAPRRIDLVLNWFTELRRKAR